MTELDTLISETNTWNLESKIEVLKAKFAKIKAKKQQTQTS